MTKMYTILVLLLITMQVKAQQNEVEIYMVQSNTIVKGEVKANTSDSFYVKVDSLHTLAFAKSELEGIDLPISKEIKKLCRKLIINEMNKTRKLFPGIYQMRNGDKLKGKFIFVLASIGVLTFITSGGILIVGLATVKDIGVIFVMLESFIVYASSVVIWGSAKIWNDFDNMLQLKKMVNSRYYYTGNELVLNNYNQTN